MKALDLLRTLGWALIHFIFQLIDSLFDILKGLNAYDIIEKYDMVVDCSDNATTRYLIDEVCAMQKKPFVYGAITEYTGQVSVFDASNDWRYSELFPDRTSACNQPQTIRGVVGALAGIIGSTQACEVIKMITGMGEPLINAIFTIDIRTMDCRKLRFK